MSADDLIARLRELVPAHGVRGAARLLGMDRERVRFLAKKHGLRINADHLHAIKAKNALHARACTQQANAAPKPDAPAPLRKRNPALSDAQQRCVDEIKRASWTARAMRAARGMDLPPISDEEAARLRDEYLAKHGATICPPQVMPDVAINAGVGWARGRAL